MPRRRECRKVRMYPYGFISTPFSRLRLLRWRCRGDSWNSSLRGNRPENHDDPRSGARGNDKFLTDSPVRGVQGRERRVEIARGQTPFAVLVSCSDSRVPPELLFGRGLGELFIIRNAGNTVDTTALGSIQYAVAELGVPLVLVLGHERCGAVDAAVKVVKENASFPGSIGQMIEPIIPAVIKAQAQQGDILDNAVRENVRRVVNRLRTASEPLLLDPLKAKKLRIVGARYDLDDGDVDFFDEG
jgi:carbonic anhydrase